MRLTKSRLHKIVKEYGGMTTYPPPPEENKWFKEFKPYAESEAAIMCRKYPQTYRDDHYQAAYLGLWEASLSYDDGKGSMMGWADLHLKKYLYDQARVMVSPVTVSRRAYEEEHKIGFKSVDLKAALDSNSPLFGVCLDNLDICIGKDSDGFNVVKPVKPNEAFLERSEEEQRIIKDLVATGLKSLKLHDREILSDRFEYGLTYNELSKKWCKSVNSLKSKVKRLIKRLSLEIK